MGHVLAEARGKQKPEAAKRPGGPQRAFANADAVRLTVRVLRSFFRRPPPPPPPANEPLLIGGRLVPLRLTPHPRARRYRLRLAEDGSARVTIPRGGNLADARAFVERSRAWLQIHLERLLTRPRLPQAWPVGTEILFRGEPVIIAAEASGQVRFASEIVSAANDTTDWRAVIELHLRRLAARELPARVRTLAAAHQLRVNRVTIRNQRSRWGSCTRTANISLNWRLVQMPGAVSDYIILHELAHLRHLDHSRHFWAEVERLCPDYRVAERWLKAHRHCLR